MTETLPLLIATDQNLLFAAATMVRSAHASLADGFEFDVYAYLEGVPDAEVARFSEFFEQEFNRPPRVITDQSFPPEHQRLMNELADLLAQRFPKALYARLFMPTLVGDAARAVYLDVDVAVVRDVAPLWSVSLHGNAVGAVRDPAPDPVRQLAVRYPKLRRYLNSGVLAIDTAMWRDTRVGERAIAWLLADGKASYFPDQDALNVVLMADDGAPLWGELEPVWNTIGGGRRPIRWPDGAERLIPPDEVRLRHFAGSFKPWNTDGLLFGDVFNRHLAAVPFSVPERLRTRERPSLARRWARRIKRKLGP